MTPTGIVLADAGLRQCCPPGHCDAMSLVPPREVWVVQTADSGPVLGARGVTDPSCGEVPGNVVLVNAHSGHIIATVAWGPAFGVCHGV